MSNELPESGAFIHREYDYKGEPLLLFCSVCVDILQRTPGFGNEAKRAKYDREVASNRVKQRSQLTEVRAVFETAEKLVRFSGTSSVIRQFFGASDGVHEENRYGIDM